MTAPIPIPGGPTQTGVIDHSLETPELPIHLEDGPSTSVAGVAGKQQVVQVESARAMMQIIELLMSIDRRLGNLEELSGGIPSD